MSFISIQFAIFFLVLIVVVSLLKKKELQHIVLLAGSYFFYAMGDIRFLGLLAGISVLMWFLGIQISKNRKRAKLFVAIGVVTDLLVLGFFKYLNFFLESFCNLLGMQFTSLMIILPLGISFYIFQSISYIVDIYRGKIEAEKNILNVLLFIGFFPQIVSGPIVKAYKFMPQLKNPVKITKKNLSKGLQRVLLGIFKKLVIADRLGVCVNAVFAAPKQYNSISVVLAVISYTLQVYFDFSGYSDMAIGLATVLGFDLGENFNLPFLAKNQSDFWQRWHISLSSWFKEYVYFPLGGNRKGKLRTYFNLLVTMIGSGIWHGASWTYVLWGVVQGLFSVINKLFTEITKKKKNIDNKVLKSVGGFLSICLTYICFALSFVIFRADSIENALQVFGSMFSFDNGIFYVYDFSLIFIALVLIVELVAAIKNNFQSIWKPLDLSKFRNKVIILLFTVVTFVFAYIGDTAFIYAAF